MTDPAYDLACLLRMNVRSDDNGGYFIVGLWCSPGGSFATRQEAEARLLSFARERYPAPTPAPAPPPTRDDLLARVRSYAPDADLSVSRWVERPDEIWHVKGTVTAMGRHANIGSGDSATEALRDAVDRLHKSFGVPDLYPSTPTPEPTPMPRSRSFPDGLLELDWTSNPPAVRARLDGGAWRPIAGDNSAFAAWDRIRDAGTAREALAILGVGCAAGEAGEAAR